MKSPEIVSITPDKPNIMYLVQNKPITIEEAVFPLIKKIAITSVVIYSQDDHILPNV